MISSKIASGLSAARTPRFLALNRRAQTGAALALAGIVGLPASILGGYSLGKASINQEIHTQARRLSRTAVETITGNFETLRAEVLSLQASDRPSLREQAQTAVGSLRERATGVFQEARERAQAEGGESEGALKSIVGTVKAFSTDDLKTLQGILSDTTRDPRETMTRFLDEYGTMLRTRLEAAKLDATQIEATLGDGLVSVKDTAYRSLFLTVGGATTSMVLFFLGIVLFVQGSRRKEFSESS